MSRETRAIANANHILNLLERFPAGAGAIHGRNCNIGLLNSYLRMIKEKGPKEIILKNLEWQIEKSEKWLVARTMERMEAGR